MKLINSITFLFILSVFVILFLPHKCYGQLNGSYTINPTRSASSSNYQNWASAVGDLISGSRSDGGTPQGAGVNGRVTFTVYDTTYNTAIEITSISGASYANTITFKSAGGDSSKCILKNASSTSSTNDFVVMLNGADYITFQEIGMERTGTNTYSTVVQISNDADKNRFIRCFLKGRKIPSSSSLGFAYGIGSIIFFTGTGDSTEITQNKIIYGYNGIYCTFGGYANKISNNIVDTSGSSGVYMTTQTSLRITGNTFNMGDFGPSRGHYTSYGMRIETSPGLLIANNKVYMSAVNGQVVRAIVMAGNTSTSSAPAMVYNNWVVNSGGTADCSGLAVYGCSYLNFYYNNILITNSLANGSAYFHYAPPFTNSYINLSNNNLINKGGGFTINVPGSNTSDLDSVNYNNLYSTGSSLGNWNATTYSSLSAWKSGTGKDANSLNVDPGYVSNSRLHVSNIGLNGKALYDSRIREDIDGEIRDYINPDIGADEFLPIAIDAGVANLDSPILFCAGTQKVKVSFQNYGYDTLKSVQIQWQINGSTQTPYNWTGKLSPGVSSASITLGNFTFSSNTAYTFKIWTRIPNNTTDGKNINDTLKLTRLPSMTGSYSIGDTSVANYKSFNEAITDMTTRAICGSITFNVYKGTYNEQITLVQLPGMGASNPVTFQSINKDSTSVTVTHPSTVATGNNNAVVQLRGADYVTFKGITFERTGSNPYGHVVHILNESHHNTFAHCRMLGLILTAANVNAMNIWSDQGRDNYNSFINNFVKSGNYSIQYAAPSTSKEVGTVIEGNIFESAFNNSVQISYNDSIQVKGNRFMDVRSHLIGNYDIQLLDCHKGIEVMGNIFKNTYSDTSLWLMGCNASSSNKGFVANNSILRNYGKGILLDGVDHQNVVFNSIYFSGNLPDNAGIYSSSTTSSNIVMKNNNIVMEGGEVFHISNGSQVSESENSNLLVKSGSRFAYWGSAYSNLSGLVAVTGKDVTSFSLDPLFLSSTDLHIKNPLFKGRAIPITEITIDIDRETRNKVKPDIGADEFKRVPHDAGVINLSKPMAGVCAGLLDVEVTIKNHGNDTLKSVSIQWSVNGAAQSPFNWTGKLGSGDTGRVVIGSYNFSNVSNPRFILKTSLPNAKPDEIGFNDSIIVTQSLKALPIANAGADMVVCKGDSVTLGSNPGVGFSYKWMTITNTTLSNSSKVTVAPAGNSEYVLEVIHTASGCTKKDTVKLNVITKPIADAGKDLVICPDQFAQIGETPQTGFIYNWKSEPQGYSSSIANPKVSPIINTTYIMEKTISGSACNDFDTVKITVASVPIAKIQGKDNICMGSRQIYTTPQNAGSTYNWILTMGKVISGQNTNGLLVEWNTAGSTTFKVIETNASGCTDTATYFVTVSPNPTANFNKTGNCVGKSIKFNNTSTGAQFFNWTFGDGDSSTVKEPSNIYPEARAYNVRLIVKNEFNCYDTITKQLPIDPLPVAAFTFEQKSGNKVEFTNTSSISSGTINVWNWKFGTGDSSALQNPIYTYARKGNYTITLCVKSVDGCENCTTKNIGIANIKNQPMESLHVYPNPGNGVFYVSSPMPIANLSLTNMVGQLINTYQPISTFFELNISDKPCGVYFIKVDYGGKTQVLRVIKE